MPVEGGARLVQERTMATFMMESIPYFGIGSLLGALPAVALSLPVISRRARATQLVELGRGDAIKRFKIDLGALSDRLRATEEKLKVKATAAREAQCSLSDKESELAKLRSAFDERSALVDLQKTDLVAAGMQVEALKGRLAQMGQEVKAAEERRHGAERALSDKETEMARLTSAFGERSLLADSQKLEIMILGTQVQALQERLIQSGEEAKALEGLREAAECALSERDSKLVATMRALDERSALADSQKDEIAALTMQIETLQGRVTQAEEEVKAVESRRVLALRSLSEKESEFARLTISLTEGSVLVESQKAEIVTLVMQVQRLNEQLVQASEETRAVEAHRDAAVRALSEQESAFAEPRTTHSENSAIAESRNTEAHKLNDLLVQANAETRTDEDQRDAAACILSEEESAATRLAIALNECSVPQDPQKVANAALRVQIRALNERLIHAGKEAQALGELHEAERRELKAATKELMEERSKFENFYQHVTGLVEQLTA
jgi:chromosome segregation ATPase